MLQMAYLLLRLPNFTVLRVQKHARLETWKLRKHARLETWKIHKHARLETWKLHKHARLETWKLPNKVGLVVGICQIYLSELYTKLYMVFVCMCPYYKI